MPRIQAQAQNEIEDDEYFETVKETFNKFLDDIRITIQHETAELLPKLRKNCPIYLVRFRHGIDITKDQFGKYNEYDDAIECQRLNTTNVYYLPVYNLVTKETVKWILEQCEINDDLFRYRKCCKPAIGKRVYQ